MHARWRWSWVSIVCVASCISEPAVPCDQSLLHRDSGFTLASPAGTMFKPTVIFSDPDGQRPDQCHYARNQGDEVCTEPGNWVDLNPGDKDGMLTVTPRSHACGGFAINGTYTLAYSFTKIQGLLWIESWSDNQ